MVNRKNVEALTELVRSFHASDDAVRDLRSDITVLIATHLASHGALMPSTLTDEEATDLIRGGFDVAIGNEGDDHQYLDTDYYPTEFREALEKIAKGEA